MCSDVGECSRGCAAYSVVGAIFTAWVGIMISTQSFFIAGIEDPEEAKNSAFGAMGMFIFTFIASIGGIVYDTQFKKEVPPVDEAAEGYQLTQGDQPTYGTSA